MVKSANDAGFVLACAVGGSQSAFVDLMNRRAFQLGLRDTHYRNPTGSQRDPGHHSSVYDLARLGRYAMRNPAFRDLVGRPGLRSLVTATLGAPARDVDARDHVALFEWASTLYERKAVVAKDEIVRRVPVSDGTKLDAVAQTTLSRVVRSAATIVRKVTLPSSLRTAPPPGTVLVVAAPAPTPSLA